MRRIQVQKGFTIVELLIVIVVIAILAAITIVAYTGIQNRAYDTSVQSDLSAIARKYELYKADSTSNIYPYGSTLNDGIAFKLNISKNAYDASSDYQLLNCTFGNAIGAEYGMLAKSRSGKKFMVSSSSGVREFTAPGVGIGLTTCNEVMPGSSANGAGYSSSIWRHWTNG